MDSKDDDDRRAEKEMARSLARGLRQTRACFGTFRLCQRAWLSLALFTTPINLEERLSLFVLHPSSAIAHSLPVYTGVSTNMNPHYNKTVLFEVFTLSTVPKGELAHHLRVEQSTASNEEALRKITANEQALLAPLEAPLLTSTAIYSTEAWFLASL